MIFQKFLDTFSSLVYLKSTELVTDMIVLAKRYMMIKKYKLGFELSKF